MIGILAFGSLLSDCGAEIKCSTERIIDDVETPFPIEFARISQTRGGAPTLVPVKTGGEKVKGKIFCLKSTISLEEAKNILYRREINKVCSGLIYKQPDNEESGKVLIKEDYENFECCEIVVYTDFNECGKENLSPEQLANKAIESVCEAKEGKDGITYLLGVKANGVHTPLMDEYEREIVRQIKQRICAKH